jgi:hypothetical protein
VRLRLGSVQGEARRRVVYSEQNPNFFQGKSGRRILAASPPKAGWQTQNPPARGKNYFPPDPLFNFCPLAEILAIV